MLELIIKTLSDKKAEDIVAIDRSNSSPICDYFVICSALNERQMISLANALDDELAKNNYKIKKIDGKGSKWIIVDAVNIMIHIFDKEERENYKLEKLWSAFPKADIESYK